MEPTPTDNTSDQAATQTAPINQPVASSEPAAQAQPIPNAPVPKKSRKIIWIAVLVLVLIVGGVASGAILGKRTTISEVSSLLKDRTLIRYPENGAFELDESGAIKKEDQKSVRRESFEVQLEKNNIADSITLDKSTVSFGLTTEHLPYSLKCTVPAVGQVGGDNASFVAQFYDRDGNPTSQLSWKGLDIGRPAGVSEYCNDDYFSVDSGKLTDFTPRRFGKVLVDDLNYKIVFTKSDGSQQDIDVETAADINIPLGASPDGRSFMYNRLSAKRVQESCGDPQQLAYKVPDYAGPINELHVVDIETKKDTLIGKESSFEADGHEITISAPGYFSADSKRYYLIEGGQGGCRGGANERIRIAYIDLTTNSLKEIKAPADKDYNAYCFTADRRYVLETGSYLNDSKKPGETRDPKPSPTILNTQDSSTYQDDQLTADFECRGSNWQANSFLAYSIAKDDPQYDTTTGLSLFDPATREAKKVTLDEPIPGDSLTLGVTTESSKGYLNRSSFYDKQLNQSMPGSKRTILFDYQTGETVDIPFADFVL